MSGVSVWVGPSPEYPVGSVIRVNGGSRQTSPLMTITLAAAAANAPSPGGSECCRRGSSARSAPSPVPARTAQTLAAHVAGSGPIEHGSTRARRTGLDWSTLYIPLAQRLVAMPKKIGGLQAGRALLLQLRLDLRWKSRAVRGLICPRPPLSGSRMSLHDQAVVKGHRRSPGNAASACARRSTLTFLVTVGHL